MQAPANLSINGVAEGVDDTAQDPQANGNVNDGPCPLHHVSLLDELVVAKHDHTHIVRLQVESHALKHRKEETRCDDTVVQQSTILSLNNQLEVLTTVQKPLKVVANIYGRAISGLSTGLVTTEVAHGINYGLTFSPLENSTISSAWMFLRPYTRAMPSPMLRTRPVSSSSAFSENPKMRCSRMEDTSAVDGPPETQSM